MQAGHSIEVTFDVKILFGLLRGWPWLHNRSGH